MQRWALFFLLLLTACQTSTHTKQIVKQQLNVNIPSDPSTLDPRKGVDTIASIFLFLLYDGLTRLKADGQVELALAESMSLSEDRMVYTFTLRDACWSNGRPIKAVDFEQSWKSILDPNFPAANASLFYPIKNAEQVKKGILPPAALGLRVESDKRLVITLEHPTPYFLELISFCTFFPICSDLDANWEQKIEESILSSGPFLLKEWKRNNEIVLVKNPNYYRAQFVQLPAIHVSMIDSETTAFQMYEKDELDILGHPLMPLPAEAISGLLKSRQLQIRPVAATTFCNFNIHRFPFTNAKIRRAFGLAMNRKEIVENITRLSEEPALSIVPPIVKQNRHTIFFQDANTKKAFSLFEEGLKELQITRAEFPKITYYYAISELEHKVAQVLQQQWQKALGVQVSLQQVEKKALLHLLYTRNYVFAQSHWSLQYRDPMNTLERFKYADNAKNFSAWESPHFVQCLHQSNFAKTPEERLNLLEEAEAILLNDMPLAPIFHWNSAFIAKDYVKSFDLAPIGNGFFDQICLAEEPN